jgi:hypothetical protein
MKTSMKPGRRYGLAPLPAWSVLTERKILLTELLNHLVLFVFVFDQKCIFCRRLQVSPITQLDVDCS